MTFSCRWEISLKTTSCAFREILLVGSCVTTMGTIGADASGAPISLQYVIPQNGSPAPDPSLIDARLDDGLGSTSQGFQTYDDFNDQFLDGTMFSSLVDDRTVLRRKIPDNHSQAGLR